MAMTDGIRVLIAEDQALVRGALVALLNLERDIDVIADCGDGATAVDLAACHRPDVCLLDIEMPVTDGITATREIRALDDPPRVLILTTFGRAGYLRRAMDSGASGFMVKDSPAEELAEAIRRIHAGLTVIDPALARDSLAAGTSPLTDREAELLRLALTGATVADIASSVHLTQGTVRNHLSRAIAKTHTANRMEAAVTARDLGWI